MVNFQFSWVESAFYVQAVAATLGMSSFMRLFLILARVLEKKSDIY